MSPTVVWQLIPHLAVGGATQVALWLCERLDPARFQVKLLAGAGNGPEGNLVAEVRAAGVDLELLPDLWRDIKPVADHRCHRDLAARLRDERPDVVHAHGSKALWLAGHAARGTTTRAIHTAHGWPFHEYQRAPSRWLQVTALRGALRHAAAIVAVSQATRDVGLRYGIGRADQYRVIYPGADLAAFADAQQHREAVRRELSLPSDAPVVGSVMRLSPQKAPLDLVRAAALVAAQRPETYFVIVGAGELQPQVEEAIARADLADRFRLTGTRRDVPRLLGAFDIFALASLWEGLPIVYAEASAAGLPVVATDVAGAGELVGHGETGLLSPPSRPDLLAANLLDLLADLPRARALGQAGRERVTTMGFDIAEVVRRHEELYEAVVNDER